MSPTHWLGGLLVIIGLLLIVRIIQAMLNSKAIERRLDRLIELLEEKVE